MYIHTCTYSINGLYFELQASNDTNRGLQKECSWVKRCGSTMFYSYRIIDLKSQLLWIFDISKVYQSVLGVTIIQMLLSCFDPNDHTSEKNQISWQAVCERDKLSCEQFIWKWLFILLFYISVLFHWLFHFNWCDFELSLGLNSVPVLGNLLALTEFKNSLIETKKKICEHPERQKVVLGKNLCESSIPENRESTGPPVKYKKNEKKII